MKKIVIVFFILSLNLSCQNKQDNFTSEMIDELIIVDNGLPSKYSFLDLYILTNNNEILKTNNNELNAFYKHYYYKKFKTVHEFLDEVLNKKFIFDKSKFSQVILLESFKPNQDIEKEYYNFGFNEFFKKYSKKNKYKNDVFELNKSIIKAEQYLTIVYLLYINKYDMGIDCYIGKEYITARVNSFK